MQQMGVLLYSAGLLMGGTFSIVPLLPAYDKVGNASEERAGGGEGEQEISNYYLFFEKQYGIAILAEILTDTIKIPQLFSDFCFCQRQMLLGGRNTVEAELCCKNLVAHWNQLKSALPVIRCLHCSHRSNCTVE